MITEKDFQRGNAVVRKFTKRDMKELDPSILFQAMVGINGLKKTLEVLDYYLELKDEIEEKLL